MKKPPVFYKPKFCCECGEKIERAEWRWLTSRKFCEDCDLEFGTHDRWRIGIGATTVLLAGIFAAAATLNLSAPKQTVIVQSKQPAAATVSPAPNQANTKAQTAPPANSVVAAQTAAQTIAAPQSPRALAANPNNAAAPPVAEQPIDSAYYCGARTQKGTPCTRRVRGGGRCWQHTGKTAMMTQEKLLIYK